MDKIVRFIDHLNEWIGTKVAWLTTALVIVICIDVAFRYLMNVSKIWIIELEWHLFGVLFLLGAAYTWKHDKHVRVDLFYEKYSPKTKGIVNLLGTLLFVLPWCYLAITTTFDYALNSFSYREGSQNPNGLPARYLIKFVMTVGFTLLFLQAIPVIFRSVKQIKTNKDTEEWK